MGSNDKISKEPDHNHASEHGTPAIGKHIEACEGSGDPERDRLMAADKGLSTWEEMSEEMKQVSLGGHSFATMREKDRYYVDKTLLIKDVIDAEDDRVYLFTRPRRFGKTTNLTMLDAFFNEEYKGNTWFYGLEISNYPEYDKYKNAFPVIRLDLNDTKASTYESFVNKLRTAVKKAYTPHEYLLNDPNVDPDFVDIFRSVKRRDIAEDFLETSLDDLSEAIFMFSGKKPIILIDEYDCAVSDYFGEESHRKILDFLGGFLRSAVKTNANRSIVYMTGVMQIAQESIFSGLNNVKVNNIFSTRSDERFGFTESEVKGILEYYGHPEKLDEVREWYDGYRFGNADVYNPFSIMNYVDEGFEPTAYWANSGGDSIVRHLLERINSDNLDKIINLFTRNKAQTKLKQQLTYRSVYSSDVSLFSLMAMTGYLNAVPVDNGIYEISIPNAEVLEIFADIVDEITPIDDTDFIAFNRAVLDGDAERIVKVLEKILITASYMDLNPSTPENPYEMIVATLLIGVCKRYTVRTQREADLGRSDIIMFPKAEGDVGMVFELKTVGSEDEMDAGVEEAMDQIHKKGYHKEMPGKDVVILGICFWSKLAKARTEIVEVPVG